MEQKIAVFIFCYTITEWKERLDGQLKRMQRSGLYDAAHRIELVTTYTSDEKLEELNTFLKDYPTVFSNATPNHGYEAPALSALDKFVRSTDEEYKVLYFHVKGIFNWYKNFETKEFYPLKYNGLKSWTSMMEHFVIDKWKTCTTLLDEYDTVGTTNNYNWWWGNFWWTKSSHIKQIQKFDEFFNGSRWNCEAWLQDSHPDRTQIKYFEMYRFWFDPHFSIIPDYFYNGTDLRNLHITVEKAQYGYFAEQRDEGRPFTTFEDELVDVTERVREYVARDNNTGLNFTVENNQHSFPYEQFCDGKDPSVGNEKKLRVWFRTNIDPDNEYIVSSFSGYPIRLGYLKND